MRTRRLLFSTCFTLLLLPALDAAAQSPPNPAQAPAHVDGHALIDNERITVQKYIVQPGAPRVQERAAGNQIWVQMNDGEWKSGTSPAAVSKAGAVEWIGGQGGGPEKINGGSTPIEMLRVTLKPHTAAAADIEAMKNYRLIYPDIPGQVLLENDQVVVQRFIVKPGEWEGIHAHPGNQLYIHIKGGTWDMREIGRESRRPLSPSATGSVGWFRAIPIEKQHQSGNAGTEPIDLIWVTLKK